MLVPRGYGDREAEYWRLINDPIALKIDDDCYWLSVGNSDIWFWARCVAGERGLDVEVGEPDVSPLAVQGPKAEDVVASLVGDWIRDLKYFWFGDAELEGIPLKIARSGWSKQGGFELYLMDGSKGDQLWQLVKEAGKPFDIGPGYPNPSERTERTPIRLKSAWLSADHVFVYRAKTELSLGDIRSADGASAGQVFSSLEQGTQFYAGG